MKNSVKSIEISEPKNYIQNVTIFAIHCLAAYSILSWNITPWSALILFYVLRVFLVSAGIHRYFCHKSFLLNRFFQFVFALGATLCLQNSVFWWAAKHRDHHKFINNKELDPHSHQRGWFWSHIGWILCDDDSIDENSIKDLIKFKELVFLHKHYKIINLLFATLVWYLFGFLFFTSVYCLGTVLAWHTMFLVNSLCHKVGYRTFKTKDNSTNILALSLITLGESLHNNHHSNPCRPNNRVKWFEIDLTYVILYVLSLIKIVKFKRK